MAELDRETIDRGRQHIASLRAQLRGTGSPARAESTRTQPVEQTDGTVAAELGDDPAAMAALMAAGAERDRLDARIRELEEEVARLRAAYADVLTILSTAIHPDK